MIGSLPYSLFYELYGITLLATILHLEYSSVYLGPKFCKPSGFFRTSSFRILFFFLQLCEDNKIFSFPRQNCLAMWKKSNHVQLKMGRSNLKGLCDIAIMYCGVGGNFRCGCCNYLDISQKAVIQCLECVTFILILWLINRFIFGEDMLLVRFVLSIILKKCNEIPLI